MVTIDSSRLRKGAAAGMLAIVVRSLSQFLQVPFLYAMWPSDQASAWLLIWTLPSYMVLTVSAFNTAGGNQVVAASTASDPDAARAAFRATRLAIAVSTGALSIGILAGFPLLIDLSQWGVDRHEALLTLLAVTAYVAVFIHGSALQAAYRFGGDYGGYGFLDTLGAALELAVSLLAVALTRSIWVVPTSLALTRMAVVAVISVNAKRRWPDLFGPAEVTKVWAELKTMAAPFLGFMTGPLLLAININGYALLVSKHYGPALFAIFLTVRTLVRLADNGINLVYSVLTMELSYARTPQADRRSLPFLSGLAFAGLAITGSYVTLLYLWGDPIQHVWTSGKAAFSGGLVLVFGACLVLRTILVPFAALLASRNAHTLPNFIYLLLSALTFGMSMIAASRGASLVQVAAWQIMAEALQLAISCYYCARLLGLSLSGFVIDVCRSGPKTAWQLARTPLARQGKGLEGSE